MSQVSKKKESQACPDEDLWLKLAANVLDTREARALLRHASDCSECAQRLKTFVRYSTFESTPVVETGSLTPDWQNKLAERMAREVQLSAKRKEPIAEGITPLRMGWKLGLVVFGAVIAVVSIVILIFPRKERPDIESLLANAYRDHRTIEARIPGAVYSELTITKGGTEGSLITTARPAGAITSFCENKRETPRCLLYEARLNLLGWQYRQALATLAKIDPAAPLTPPQRKDFLINHALALFEKAKKEKEVQPPGESYKGAAEDLSQVLANDSNDNVALFNRALIYEELQMPESARADWRRLIALEKDSGWKSEAQRHLDAIEGKKKPASRD